MSELTRPDASATCDPRHLATLMGLKPGDIDIDKEKVIFHVEPPANAQSVIDSYVYDPDWDKPKEAKRKKELAAKSSLTASEVQEALKLLLRGF